MPSLETYSSAYVAYDALATEIILPRLNDFASSIEWRDQFDALDDSTQSELRKIDGQIRHFTELDFGSEKERLQRLLKVFFDCFLGFLYGQWQKQGGDNELDLIYYSLIREPWQRWFRKHKDYIPSGSRVLCTYSSCIDITTRLNNAWVTKAVQKIAEAERKDSALLIRELGLFLRTLDNPRTQLPSQIQEPSDLLKVTLGYVKRISSGQNPTSKVDVQNDSVQVMWDVVDLINEIGKDVGGLWAPGGAAATGAEELLTLEEMPNRAKRPHIHLMPPFVSNNLLDLLHSNLQILWFDPKTKALRTDTAQDLKEFRKAADHSVKHPETRNIIIEFSSGNPIVYCSHCGEGIKPGRTDRLIVRNRYAYHLNGRIDRATTQQNEVRLKVNGLFGFDSGITNELSLDERLKLVRQVANEKYHLLVLAGLQSLDETVQSITERELAEFTKTAPNTKIHTEVSGIRHLPWLIKVIKKYNFHSVSMGEELKILFQTLRDSNRNIINFEAKEKLKQIENELEEVKSSDANEGYHQIMMALGVAYALDLERLYVHGVDIDIIVRKGALTIEERCSEIQADLVAKWVVLRKLMSQGQITRSQISQIRDTMTQVKEEGFQTLWDAARKLDDELSSSSQENSFLDIALYGAVFGGEHKQTVMLVPVRWVYGPFQDRLRIVGAGDTSSIISATLALSNLRGA